MQRCTKLAENFLCTLKNSPTRYVAALSGKPRLNASPSVSSVRVNHAPRDSIKNIRKWRKNILLGGKSVREGKECRSTQKEWNGKKREGGGGGERGTVETSRGERLITCVARSNFTYRRRYTLAYFKPTIFQHLCYTSTSNLHEPTRGDSGLVPTNFRCVSIYALAPLEKSSRGRSPSPAIDRPLELEWKRGFCLLYTCSLHKKLYVQSVVA